LAQEGLRTLCIAYKEIDLDFYNEWKIEYKLVSVALENREAQVKIINIHK
jgi:hypothetical protein